MIRFYTILLLVVVVSNSSLAQNEFYNNGSVVYINGRLSTSIPTLRVNGSVTNNNGEFTNAAGLIELSGNWSNISTTNYYVSTGIERFTDTFNQTISGNWAGTTLNRNQFYDFKINKPQDRGQYVSLLDSVNINSSGSLEFESTHGIIRTQGSSIGTSHATSTGDYSNSIYLRNPIPGSFIGHSVSNGAITRYIEGKFKRQVDRIGTYYFPIGVRPEYVNGMNAFQLKFNSAPSSTAILGYLEPSSGSLVNSDYVYCDVAQVDNNPVTTNNFSTCIGPPDGIIDEARLTNRASHQWQVIPYGSYTWDYDIALYPGVDLNSSATYTPIPCGPYKIVKYIARNGIPGGNLATYQPAAGFGNRLGYFMCVTRDTLPSQTGFSNFQIWGAVDANTMLPVELLFLTANAIDNSYIKVSWATATERNNKGFVLQRSINGTSFDSIAWIPGNGTTSVPHYYAFDDYNVAKGIDYYYRLKQFDFDGGYSYSNIVSARLIPENIASVIIYPNPSNDNTTLQIFSPVDDLYSIKTFNAIGQLMYNQTIEIQKGISTLVNLPSNDWAKGVYIINVLTTHKKETQGIRFIKD